MERRLQGRTERSYLPKEPWLFLWPKGTMLRRGEVGLVGGRIGFRRRKAGDYVGRKIGRCPSKRAPVDGDD